MEGKVLEVNNLTKTYGSKGFQTKVLKWLRKNNAFEYAVDH